MSLITNQKRWALVVDDEEDFNELISESISKIGFKTISSKTLSDAKIKTKNQKFDCIFLDMRLGDQSGEELIEAIRQEKHGFNIATPIMVMSGFLDLELIGRIGKDVNDILVKPFDLKTFHERLNSVMSAPTKTLAIRMSERSKK
jgi:DNA-binding response OmpR family regulator